MRILLLSLLLSAQSFYTMASVDPIQENVLEIEGVKTAKKKYCIWIRQDGKNWYECSPLAYSPSNAVDLMKKRYPNANVTRSSDSNCDCD